MHDKQLSADSEVLAAYRRMLIDRVRYLPFAGLSDEEAQHLPFADRYIERALIPLGADQSNSNRLGDLVRAPGARVVLAGEPGSGKSTCLHHLVRACVAVGEESAADLMVDWPGAAPLPLLLRIREPGGPPDRTGLAPANEWLSLFAFWPVAEEFLRGGALGLLIALTSELQSGGCLVLIDGDELADAAGVVRLNAAIEHLLDDYPDNRYTVTCRSHFADALVPLDGFTAYALAPFDDGEVEAMIARWYPAIAGADRTPDALAERISILQGALRGDERLRSLVGSPQALALYIRAAAQGQPPLSARAAVLRQLLGLALDRATGGSWPIPDQAPAPDTLATPEQRLAPLQALALAFQSLPQSGADPAAALPHAEVEAVLCAALAPLGVEWRRAVAEIIPRLLASWQRQGLLIQTIPGSYAMPRQPLRDYLAAHAVAAQPDFPARAYALRHDPRWRESLLLATHELARDEAPVAALALPRLLLGSAAPGGQGAPDLLLAAECLLELDQRAEPARTVRGEACERLAALLSERACPVADRIRASLLLGRLGDPRFAGPLPPVVEVAAGPYLFGSREGYEDEGPARRVDVPAFAIGVYPVTNQEYARFLADVPGYPRPRYWHDGRFNNPSQPVVGVTWDDARAYCDWLTAGLLPRDMVARLPLEVEWEKAAAWDPKRRTKRRYPWGDEWSSGRANTTEGRGMWMTAPVGCYPDGVSAYGVHDLIGNVWEWTASEYASYPGAAAPFHVPGSYTLRGSSCVSLPTHARCTFRSRLPAGYWRYHLGFRIVLAAR